MEIFEIMKPYMGIFQTQPGGMGPRIARKFSFLAPTKMTIRKTDGTHVLMGYGIGDIIEVMQYSGQYCISGDSISEVELSDGSFLLDNGEQISLKQIHD